MTRLRTCEGCARHVFVTETRCPFCQQALAPVTRSPIFDIRAGMSRAQRYTLVAAVAGQTLLGCADDPKSGSQGGDSGTQQGTGGAMQGTGGVPQGTGGQAVYGGAFAPGTGGMSGSGSGGSQAGGTGGQGIAVTHYGAPMPPVDAGAGTASDAGDAGDAKDAGPDAGADAGRVQAVYGAPIPAYGIPPR